jgi:hypothetical protein
MKKCGFILKVVLAVISFYTLLFCCGGGVMPYVPSGTGASANNTSKQFFLIDKSVTTSILDGKSLQPLFRTIVNAGNERKSRNLHRVKKSDSTDVKKNDDKEKCPFDTTLAEPVLNLHKLH